MKNILFFVLLTLPAIFQAQTTTRWNMALVNSYDGCYRFTKAHSNLDWLKKEMDSTETWKSGFSSGLNASFQVTKNLALVGGFTYANRGQQLKSNALLGMSYYRTTYQFIEVPVFARFSKDLSENSKLQLGVGPQILFQINTVAHYLLANSNNAQKIRVNESSNHTFKIGTIVNLSYQTKLAKCTDFQCGVVYKQQLTALSSGNVQRLPFSLGVQLGLVFHR